MKHGRTERETPELRAASPNIPAGCSPSPAVSERLGRPAGRPLTSITRGPLAVSRSSTEAPPAQAQSPDRGGHAPFNRPLDLLGIA
jgi:hypothetical protein